MSFETDFVKVFWDDATGAVHLRWSGFVNSAQLREGLEAGLALVEEKGARRWVGDCTRLGPMSSEEQAWVNTDWFPRLLAAGMERMAVIMPAKVIASMAVDNIMQEVEGTSLVTCHFGDYDEGCAWVAESAAA